VRFEAATAVLEGGTLLVWYVGMNISEKCAVSISKVKRFCVRVTPASF